MRFSELPDWVRIKLSEEGQEEFWHRVDEFGGVKQLSEGFGYSASKMYNWRSKDAFLPVEIVRQVFGNEASEDILAVKGRGRSKAIEDPEFPLSENDELLTRIDASVTVNSDGTPVYQTDDRGNAERFVELLEELGEVPYSVYVRQVFEVRYPKFLNELFDSMSFEQDLAALIDERGRIEDGKIVLSGKEVDLESFEGRLYHRDKRLKLALARDDREEIEKIMKEEARRTSDLL